MNRLSRYLRMVGGVLLLSDLICFFMTVLTISQKNYQTFTYSQFQYVSALFTKDLHGFEKGYSSTQTLIILVCIILPVLITFFIGALSIGLSAKGDILGLCGSGAVALLEIIFFAARGELEPARVNNVQVYSLEPAAYLLWAIPLLAAGVEAVAFLLRKNASHRSSDIPVSRNLMEDINISQESNFSQEPAAQPVPVKPAETPAPEAAAVQIPPYDGVPKGILRGISGIYAGAEITFGAGETLKLGRNTTNDLIFADSKKVSREHCALTWLPNEKKFQILDRSSNGSFANGREDCLPQNILIDLKPGTILDIGDSSNRFRLE